MINCYSSKQAWETVNRLFEADYLLNDNLSQRAGYDIYESTNPNYKGYISDLGNRLEINKPNGESINIWINPPKFSEYDIKECLRIINYTIYEIDDKINNELEKITEIEEARNILYNAFGKIYEILKETNPNSELIKMYNLDC